MNILTLLLGIFTIACLWQIFAKMNEPGWKSLIPFYNIYIIALRTTRSTGVAIFWSVLSMILLLLEVLPATPLAYNIGLYKLPIEPLAFAISIVVFFGYIYLDDKLSVSFGCSHLFTVGLVLLPPVFLAMLAFGNYQFFDDSIDNLHQLSRSDIPTQENQPIQGLGVTMGSSPISTYPSSQPNGSAQAGQQPDQQVKQSESAKHQR